MEKREKPVPETRLLEGVFYKGRLYGLFSDPDNTLGYIHELMGKIVGATGSPYQNGIEVWKIKTDL